MSSSCTESSSSCCRKEVLYDVRKRSALLPFQRNFPFGTQSSLRPTSKQMCSLVSSVPVSFINLELFRYAVRHFRIFNVGEPVVMYDAGAYLSRRKHANMQISCNLRSLESSGRDWVIELELSPLLSCSFPRASDMTPQ